MAGNQVVPAILSSTSGNAFMNKDFDYIARMLRVTGPSQGERFDKLWAVLDQFPQSKKIGAAIPIIQNATLIKDCARILRKVLA